MHTLSTTILKSFGLKAILLLYAPFVPAQHAGDVTSVHAQHLIRPTVQQMYQGPKSAFDKIRSAAETISANLNNLEMHFDVSTGSILRMSHPATGVMLAAPPDSAGILDIALPVKEFEPLRLASRYSKNTVITRTDSSVTIHWDELGDSRQLGWVKGKVAATVTFKALPDGQSISMSCSVANNSGYSIPQVLFPDFFGILPFAGQDGTEFRTATTAVRPFIDMVIKDHDNFYGLYENLRWFKYGDVFDRNNLVTKWVDIGGYKGGLSLFAKTWGANRGRNEGVFLQLSELTGKLRFMHTRYTEIPTGTTWESDEFVLTPHANGWAKGIIPYRQWAKQHIKRPYPLPNHVRDGLGYRSIWMKSSYYANDPKGINFRFADLYQVATEAKEHGLREIVFWNWHEGLQVPLGAPDEHLGTEDDMAKAVADCRKIGVTVSPFINVMRIHNDLAYKYGLKQNHESYVYDPEFIPVFLPRYSSTGKGPTIPQSNPLWQKSVFESAKHLADMGITSMCWDQFFSNVPGPENYLDTVMSKIRKLVKEKDPQASISGEAGTNIEFESNFLDFTWNWNLDSSDYRPLVNSFPMMRINTNIDRSIGQVKYGFADNLFLNVMTRKTGGINGSDYISNHPALSATLKQCARLRSQFLDYFVNGEFIADCVLSAKSPNAHVSAYTLPKRMLVIVVNKSGAQPIQLESDIQAWLPSANGRYQIKEYHDGNLTRTSAVKGAIWKQKVPAMKKLDIVMYEVHAE